MKGDCLPGTGAVAVCSRVRRADVGRELMRSRWLGRVVLPVVLIVAAPAAFPSAASAQPARAADESFYANQLHPLLHVAQCEQCHNDNGVASETRLEFPAAGAGKAQITAFGLKMLDLIDRRDPERSLLLRKATNRAKHTGGQRIKPGSDEEKALVGWINYLADLSDEQVRQAREKIALAERRSLEALTVRRLTHSQ